MTRATAWPLVGREDPLQLIEEAMAASGTSVVLVGSAGVGKSRLAHEILDRARARDWFVEHATATRAAASIPFGALAQVLPDEQSGADRLAMLRGVAAGLRARAAERRYLLVVDDAHLLDDASAALVYQVAQEGALNLLVTLRTGEPAPDPVTALWKDGHAARIEIGALAHESVSALLRQVLGAEIDHTTLRQLEMVSEGNPLFLRELVTGGTDSGALSSEDGVWHWQGPLLPATRLLDLIRDRLMQLDEEQLEVLEILALGEPLGATVLETLCSTRSLIGAERGGWLATSEDGHPATVRLGHPLYAEVLRARIPALSARAIRRRLAEAVAQAGTGSNDELLRIVTWRLDSGVRQPHAELMRAARMALGVFDFVLAERLARSALEAGGDTPVAMVLARALIGLTRVEEAEEVFSSIDVTADPRRLVWVVSARAGNLRWGLGKAADAEALLEETESLAPDAESRDLLANARALFAISDGRAAQAEAITATVLGRASAVRVVLEASMASAHANVMLGHVGRARSEANRALAMVNDIPGHPGALSLQLYEALATADWFDGRLACWLNSAAQWYDRALKEQSEPARALWAFHLGWASFHMGRVATARHWLEEAAVLMGDVDPVRAPVSLSALALAQLFSGDLEAARSCLAKARSGRASSLRVFHLRIRFSEGWATAFEGELSVARDRILELADVAQRDGFRLLESEALHSVARLGGSDLVVDRFEALAAETDAALVRIWAAHARALADRSGPALDDVAARLQEMGALLTAAEAAAEAANAHRKTGLRARAAASRARALRLLGECEGAHTPTLAKLDSGEMLTPREREVATLAAQGLASRAIAERLGLSIRTVDNHLRQVYAELGIRGRAELGVALGVRRAEARQRST